MRFQSSPYNDRLTSRDKSRPKRPPKFNSLKLVGRLLGHLLMNWTRANRWLEDVFKKRMRSLVAFHPNLSHLQTHSKYCFCKILDEVRAREIPSPSFHASTHVNERRAISRGRNSRLTIGHRSHSRRLEESTDCNGCLSTVSIPRHERKGFNPFLCAN